MIIENYPYTICLDHFTGNWRAAARASNGDFRTSFGIMGTSTTYHFKTSEELLVFKLLIAA